MVPPAALQGTVVLQAPIQPRCHLLAVRVAMRRVMPAALARAVATFARACTLFPGQVAEARVTAVVLEGNRASGEVAKTWTQVRSQQGKSADIRGPLAGEFRPAGGFAMGAAKRCSGIRPI